MKCAQCRITRLIERKEANGYGARCSISRSRWVTLQTTSSVEVGSCAPLNEQPFDRACCPCHITMLCPSVAQGQLEGIPLVVDTPRFAGTTQHVTPWTLPSGSPPAIEHVLQDVTVRWHPCLGLLLVHVRRDGRDGQTRGATSESNFSSPAPFSRWIRFPRLGSRNSLGLGTRLPGQPKR